MPNRIVKEAVWSSESLSKVSLLAQGFFLRLLPLPDDHGCFDARVTILRARLFPLNYAEVTEKTLEKWLQELIAVDCIRVWMESGVRYGYFPSWSKHQQVRSLHHRKTPVPPPEITEKKPGENKGDSNCNQPIAVESLNPNPNPLPNPNPVLLEEEAAIAPAELLGIWKANFGGMVPCLALTEKRRAKCRTRIEERNKDPDVFRRDFTAAVKKAGTNWFFCGGGDRQWKGTFDWFIENDTNYFKVLEGKYDAQRRQPESKADAAQRRTGENSAQLLRLVDEQASGSVSAGDHARDPGNVSRRTLGHSTRST